MPPSRELPNEEGNVFVVDNAHDIKVEWKSENHLVISGCPKDEIVFHKVDVYSGVNIEYR